MASEPAQSARPTVPVAGEHQPLPPWNVLLIEDDPTMIRRIREFFADREIDGRKMSFPGSLALGKTPSDSLGNAKLT